MTLQSAFDRAVAAITPGADTATLVNAALAALDERREDDAIALLRGPAASERSAPLHHMIGLLHRAKGDLAPALAAFDAAIAIDPASPRLIHARARAAMEAGLPSVEWFRRAWALAPQDGDIILGMAAAMLTEGDSDASDAMLVTTLMQHPGWLAGHAALAQQRFAQGRTDWLALLDTAIATAPRDFRLHDMKIMMLKRAGAFEPTRAALAAADSIFGDAHAMRSLSAMVATELGDLRDADALFERIDPLAEPRVTIHWFRHLLRRGAPEKLGEYAGKLPPSCERSAWPYFLLAWRLTDDVHAQWLFDPAMVRIVDLPIDAGELNRLAAKLRSLHIMRAQPLDQSVRGGTQTDGPLLSNVDSNIAAMKARLSAAIDDYIGALAPHDPGHPLRGRVPTPHRFVGSWSVRLTGGGFHESHVHDEGWLSSALYVAIPEPQKSTRDGWLTLGEPQASLNLPLGPLAEVEPEPGRLVLFPSYLWHGTRPFSSGERLSVAFDAA